MKNTIHVLILLCCLACKQQATKVSVNNPVGNKPDTASIIKKTDTTQYSVPPKTLNYDNWDSFWKVFARATKKKDTATVVALTNFPFLQNASPMTQDEFVRMWVSEPFDLRSADTSFLSDAILLQLKEPERAQFDSVRVTYKNGKEFFFAKVKGYYRLIEVITPG